MRVRHWVLAGGVAGLALIQPALAQKNNAPSAKAAVQPGRTDESRMAKANADLQAAMNARDWKAAALALRVQLELNTRQYGADGVSTLSSLETLAIAEQLDGRSAESAKLYRDALARRTRRGERGKEAALQATRGLGSALKSLGQYDEAVTYLREALTLSTAAKGAESSDNAFTLNQLGEALTGAGKYPEAREILKRTYDLTRKIDGPEAPSTLASLGNWATAENNLGNYGEGARINRELINIRKRLSGPRDKTLAISLNNLGFSLANAGDMAGAEEAMREALSIGRDTYGADSAEVANTLNNIASVTQSRGRLAEAEKAQREALTIFVKQRGADHPDTLRAEMNLGTILADRGDRAEAERIFRSVYTRQLKGLGPGHPETINALSNLATTMETAGRVAEAETLYRQALTASAPSGQTGSYAILLSNLGTSVGNQGRFDEALALHRQALALREKLLGKDHPDVAISFANIGYILSQKRDYAAADAPLKRAIEIGRKSGDATLGLTTALNNYASNLDELGRIPESGTVNAEALALRRKLLPANHPMIATSLNNMGFNLFRQGKPDEAIKAFRESLAISRKVSAKGDPDLIIPMGNLALQLVRSPKGSNEALALSREASDIVRTRRVQLLGGGRLDSASQAATRAKGDTVLSADPFVTAFIAQVEVNWVVAGREKARLDALRREAFIAAQEIDVPQAAQALARTAARTAARDPALNALVTRQQDIAARIDKADSRYLSQAAGGDAAGAQATEAEIRTLSAELARIDGELEQRFPRYRSLIAPAALSVEEVRAQLQPDEALLFIVPANGHMHSFAVSRDGEAWGRVEGGQQKLKPVVATLLCQMDPVTCEGGRGSDDLVFDRAGAFGLYRDLVAPVEGPLKNAKRLYVSVIGTLGKLPLGLLPTTAPAAGSDDGDVAGLASSSWLSDRYAITLLPAVSSLRFARQSAKAASSGGFVGYGAPTLRGGSGAGVALAQNRGAGMFRGGLANPAMLNMLSPLPGTNVELSAMAKALEAPVTALRLADRATETRLKSDSDLGKSRVIAFATHGLLPGELTGFEEPGLVLTPPKMPSAEDDGILSSSEIAGLSLDADWVILSACNTAAAGAGAESLSGLARAFLLAGARGLLATHWRVDDQATASLTVETLMADRQWTRAQALQTAMKAIRTGKRADGSTLPGWQPSWSHPAYWASFSMISNVDR